jgi:hypothetical protein
MALPPYNARGVRSTTNAQDGLYNDMLLVPVIQDGQNYSATFDVGLDLT